MTIFLTEADAARLGLAGARARRTAKHAQEGRKPTRQRRVIVGARAHEQGGKAGEGAK